MPEQPTMSIKVEVAPRIIGGLHALARKHLTDAAAKKPARTKAVNKNSVSGAVRGTVFQIGQMYGQVNDHEGR
ncbi:hypothetical protein ACWEIJ_33275 [Lentzea sp. NPDC004789]